jgi:hypothetical protein
MRSGSDTPITACVPSGATAGPIQAVPRRGGPPSSELRFNFAPLSSRAGTFEIGLEQCGLSIQVAEGKNFASIAERATHDHLPLIGHQNDAVEHASKSTTRVS